MSRPKSHETEVIDKLLSRLVKRGTGYRRNTMGPALRRIFKPSDEECDRIVDEHFADKADRRAGVFEVEDEGIPIFIPDGTGNRYNIFELRKTSDGKSIALAHAKQRKRAGGTNYRVGVRIEKYIRRGA